MALSDADKERLQQSKLSYGEKYCEHCDIIAWGNHIHCPKCNAAPEFQEVRNFDEIWRDGDVHCTKCQTYVRGYDAG